MFSSPHPNYTYVQRDNGWYPIDKRTNKITGPTDGFPTEKAVKDWIKKQPKK